MLTYNLNGDVLEVKESVMSFTNTKAQYWYYNVNTWMQSSHGKLNDPCDRKMNQSSIDWVKQYYLPKV